MDNQEIHIVQGKESDAIITGQYVMKVHAAVFHFKSKQCGMYRYPVVTYMVKISTLAALTKCKDKSHVCIYISAA